MHAEAFAFIAEHAGECEGPVLEIGSRDINGTVRDLFDADYHGIDTVNGPGVDEVATGTTYKSTRNFGTVVCCEVLEHTKAAGRICANAHKLLRKGGTFLVTAAGPTREPHSAVDGGQVRPDEFYANVSVDKLKGWLSDFDEVLIVERGPDIYARAVK